MGHHQKDSGFTIAEVVVTIVVLALFLALFFQVYLTTDSQRKETVLSVAANDISQSNLRKISTKVTLPSSTTACDPSSNGSANPNNGLLNPALNPTVNPNVDPLSGSPIPTTPYAANPPANTIMLEPIAGTNLPSSTTQSLLVMYPRGCNINMPAKIISIVTYGSTSSEMAVHEALIN